ncbi:MAG: prephenate dehydrogenase [Acidobacteria bacterium]|nr:prephenate dehydrogenase [Acidobacteriota bacterium]
MQITIVGVGLIGGSLGLALKAAHPGWRILGVGRHQDSLEKAVQRGAIDGYALEVSQGIAESDLVFLATPIREIIRLLKGIGGFLKPGSLVTDVGSTKRVICETAREFLPLEVRFVGGHPLAGREIAGIEHARADLFHGCAYALCPERTSESQLEEIVRDIGAEPVLLEAHRHDEIVAYSSHLPQFISTALGRLLHGELSAPARKLAGTGLKDMVRLAGSPYEIWQDILDTNRDNILKALQNYQEVLEELRESLKIEVELGEEFLRANKFYRLLFPKNPQ